MMKFSPSLDKRLEWYIFKEGRDYSAWVLDRRWSLLCHSQSTLPILFLGLTVLLNN